MSRTSTNLRWHIPAPRLRREVSAGTLAYWIGSVILVAVCFAVWVWWLLPEVPV